MSEEEYKITPDEQADLEKQRTISDAELLKGGAKYKVDSEGEPHLEITDRQQEVLENKNSLEVDIKKYLPIGLYFNLIHPQIGYSFKAIIRQVGDSYVMEVQVDDGIVNYDIAGVDIEMGGKVLCIETNNGQGRIEKKFTDISPENKSKRINPKTLEKSSWI